MAMDMVEDITQGLNDLLELFNDCVPLRGAVGELFRSTDIGWVKRPIGTTAWVRKTVGTAEGDHHDMTA